MFDLGEGFPVAGADVPALIERLGDRIVLLHLKDGEIRQDFEGQTILGQGNMPLPASVESARFLEYGVIELDSFSGEVFAEVEGSFEYFTQLGLTR
ncbi:hypothetical protein [Subtercola vilae]|uniref:hypothetical protein n=1 Tax=Subtercola vilae TaxID=2056433 RepID=UPI0010AB1F5A|nr:hypothetical protein [Subtercola vilae]